MDYTFVINIKISNMIFNKIINKFYYTALHYAVEKENVEIVKLLLSNPYIDVNIKNIFK